MSLPRRRPQAVPSKLKKLLTPAASMFSRWGVHYYDNKYIDAWTVVVEGPFAWESCCDHKGDFGDYIKDALVCLVSMMSQCVIINCVA